jgi:protein ImuA
VSTGHAALDAQLPGEGWPRGSLVEVLEPTPGRNAWQLVLPALARMCEQEDGPVALVAAPHDPFGAGLAAQGLALSRILDIQPPRATARLWAAEQALKCKEVTSVLAWLPEAKSAELRRLHLAAAQHAKLLFVFRPLRALQESSPARLRLAIEEGEALAVRIVKRRGPPLLTALQLGQHPQRLVSLLAARRGRAMSVPNVLIPDLPDRSHVLDRTVALA